MDILKEILRNLRLKPTLFFRSDLWSPWGVVDEIPRKTVFHMLERGNCWLQISASPEPIALSEGDFVVVSSLAHYTLSTEIGTPVIPFATVLEMDREAWSRQMRERQLIPETTLICGEFQPQQAALSPMLSLLPPVIVIRSHDRSTISQLRTTLSLIAYEAKQASHGYEMVIGRLMDIIFVMVMRYWMESQIGWASALIHPTIGPVLQQIHQQPAYPWSLEHMARLALMSRSIFAENFMQLVGLPPMRYVTRWRMQLATTLMLEQPDATLDAIAARVGYASAFAFSKAYKRLMGISPSEARLGAEAQDETLRVSL